MPMKYAPREVSPASGQDECVRGRRPDVETGALEQGTRSDQMPRVRHQKNCPNPSRLPELFHTSRFFSGRPTPGFRENDLRWDRVEAGQLRPNRGFASPLRRTPYIGWRRCPGV